MIYKVLGKERKTGVYQGNPYDNTMLYCSQDNVPKVEGVKVLPIKVKTALVPATLKVGDFVDVYYNAFQAVEAVYVRGKGDSK